MGTGVQNAVLWRFFRLRVFKPSAGLQVLQANGCAVLHIFLWQCLADDCCLQWRNAQLKRAIKLAHRRGVRLGHWKYLQEGDNIYCPVQLDTNWCPLHRARATRDWRRLAALAIARPIWRVTSEQTVMRFVSHHLSDEDSQAHLGWAADSCTAAFCLKFETRKFMAGHISVPTSSRNNELSGANFPEFQLAIPR